MPETATASEKMIAVPEADLGLVLDYCTRTSPDVDTDPKYRDALDRTVEAWRAWHEAAFAEMTTPEPEPLPEGIFGRVELPGYRQHTGWITEETRFGVQVAVVRDWDGREVALAALGPGCQVVVLPTPLRRPAPMAALPAGAAREGWYPDDDEDAAESAF